MGAAPLRASGRLNLVYYNYIHSHNLLALRYLCNIHVRGQSMFWWHRRDTHCVLTYCLLAYAP